MKRVPQASVTQAGSLVKSGDVLIVGGFGMTGTPVQLLHALADTDTRDLTYVANNVGEPGLGGGRMLRNGQIRRAVGSYFTSNPEILKAAHSGEMEIELLPQGSHSLLQVQATLAGPHRPLLCARGLATASCRCAS